MQSTEAWKPVVGYERLYEVSSLGRVRSLDRITPHNSARSGTQLTRGRVRKLAVNGTPPRVTLTLWRDGGQKTRLVHHLVLEAFVGPRPEGTEGCHFDGDATNNQIDNLRWDTHLANEADKARHGTHSNAVKTHCPRGHVLESPNLVESDLRNGGRKCRACNQAGASAFKRGEQFDPAYADWVFSRIMSGRIGERVTHCPYGHLLEGANLVPSSLRQGRRQCLACNRSRSITKGKRLPFDPVLADSKYAAIMR